MGSMCKHCGQPIPVTDGVVPSACPSCGAPIDALQPIAELALTEDPRVRLRPPRIVLAFRGLAVLTGLLVGSLALALLQWSEDIPPHVADFLNANALVRGGQAQAARLLYASIVDEHPDFALAHRHLGVACSLLEDEDEARTAYETYLELASDEQDKKRIKALIDYEPRLIPIPF